MTALAPPAPRHAPRLPAVLCFAALTALVAGDAPGLPVLILLGLLGLLGGALALALLTLFLSLVNGAVRREHGRAAVRLAVNGGFLLLVPFTVLALVAELGLGWEAAAGFAAAGIITAAGAAGAELTRLGGRRLPAVLLPMLAGIGLSAAWLVAAQLAAAEVAARWP